jgi:hypothetical protein
MPSPLRRRHALAQTSGVARGIAQEGARYERAHITDSQLPSLHSLRDLFFPVPQASPAEQQMPSKC